MQKIAIGNVHMDLGAGRRGVDMGPSAIHLAGLKAGIESLGHRVVDNWAASIPSHPARDRDVLPPGR
jgi:arginase